MTAVTRVDSPGIMPVPVPREVTVIGGRSEKWPRPRRGKDADERFEPTIVRGRE
jgi:hypothetical protein